MNEELIKNLSNQINISEKRIKACLQLLESGCTIPFIARYRKEVTDALNEEEIKLISDEYKRNMNLLERKMSVIKLIDEKGLMTEELKTSIMNATKLTEVEDLYLPYKEKKKTKATEAIKMGLEPLAKKIMSFPTSGSLEELVKPYNMDKEVALTNAGYIISEWISDNAYYRGYIRKFMYNTGKIVTKVKKNNKDEAKTYEMYYDFSEPVKYLKHYRCLAINRAEKEDVILVKPGEKIPLDGIVVEGESFVDTSALTGESVPRKIAVNDEILSGGINTNGVLKVKVTKKFGESTVSRILEMVENAANKKANTEKFITKFAKVYTPIVVALAILIAVVPSIFIKDALFSTWLYRALVFLVVSCPCALVVSVPLGFFAGIGGASKKGVLVKGSNYLELLKDLETVVFDKTGTLTEGVFTVTEINTNNIQKEKLIEVAAMAESFSNHPIAISIIKEYGKEIDKEVIEEYEEIAGHGIKAVINNEEVLIGNAKLMNQFNISYNEVDSIGTVVYCAINGEFKGSIVISDKIKENADEALINLKAAGVKKTVMLTGDNKKTAEKVGEKVNIDEVHSELLPLGKVKEVEKLLKASNKNGRLAFVGDGVNDAPVLARADIGIAMGGIGSDAAIEAADVVLMKDDINALVDAINVSKKTNKILWQNIIFALGVKVIVMVLGTFGIANMWTAVFADVGVTIIAIINSTRCFR